ncbi:MAG: hypothetical protein ABEJ79_11220 [Halolamina sp.]
MDEDTETVVRLVAVQGAVVAAVIHLTVGAPRLLQYLRAWLFNDPRPYLFVPSGLVLLVVAAAVWQGRRVRPAAGVGLLLSASYMTGYAWWHLSGHGDNAPSHEVTDPVGEVAGHLLADPLALVAFVAEATAVAGFAALLVAVERADVDADASADADADAAPGRVNRGDDEATATVEDAPE